MKPGGWGYEDCHTWQDVWARMRCEARSPTGIILGTALWAMWMFQYALFTATGCDIPAGWDFLAALAFFGWNGRLFAVALVWRCCYGDVLINAALWGALMELAKGTN